ncbi:phage major tail protein, TP901-1 family (plasmid) [Skermanella rosea]|uniref:phage major tail protein, TP901-1 family n=1 Tax=Skermanella rosea TaxID=1817965 RepID=UPI001E3A89F5|nr:phage major tail protein, TP901-1 family [Skermanella rosea]UEM08064.1 phage major tail protein, TP901-1 family [Skermanella rosea]
MPLATGRLLRIKRGGGSPVTYTAIGGMRTENLSINNTEVDVTTKDDAGWRKLLQGAGVRSVSISGTGVFEDGTSANALLAAAIAGTHELLEFAYGSAGGDKFAGTFQVTQFEIAGEEGGTQTYSVTFASAGAVTHTPSA